MFNPRFLTLATMVMAAAAARLVPHWPNFTPVGAMALFGGAYFASRRAALAVPLTALLLSDLALTGQFGWTSFRWSLPVYACFALTVGLGMLLSKRRTVLSVSVASLTASCLFFVVTNFAVWAGSEYYSQTWAGLAECYVAGSPFLVNTTLGDFFYSAVLFGGFELAQRRWDALRTVPVCASRLPSVTAR
jgi:hypothetical protein